VYFYPENKEQHEHNTESEFEEESISGDEQFSRTEEVQEETDPSFEQLLYFYIKHQVIPRMKDQSSPFASPSKSVRGRANSLTSV